MNGILLIDKPAGWTSFDVVAKVRGLLRQATGAKVKVGHTGTLDPLATGLLVLMVGSYTKKVPEFTKLDKTYDVRLRLGHTSTTGDEEGEKTAVSDRRPTEAEIRAALATFVGDQLQTPPAFSAIKIKGQRAYDLARQGKTPDLAPRPITIHQIKFAKYEYPFVDFTADVSSGTYIRSLAEDLGKTLQTGAYLAALRRTRVGTLMIENAAPMESALEALHNQHLI